MGFNIKNNYGPNIEVNDGGKLTLVQGQNGLWHTVEAEEIEEAEIVEDGNTLCELKSETEENMPRVAKEDLFHFIHPSVDSDQEWAIHNEVKRLVARQGIQEICAYLKRLADEKRILLPQSPSTAYTELVRMGMPSGEGFKEKTFQKYYKR
jgi:hypothetical protein